MNSSNSFVEILLPLNLWNTYTYSVPLHLEKEIEIGKRAIIQFGKSKLYSGVITQIHQHKPQDFTPKNIEEIIDAAPIIQPIQIQFWQWLANYYMCPLGDVLFAALPSGYKLSSETSLVFNDAINYTEVELTDAEYIIAEAISIQREISAKDIQSIIGKKNIFCLIKGLLNKKIAFLKEDIVEKYAPKLETFVKLHPQLLDKEILKKTFDELEKRSTKQLNLFLSFLSLQKKSEWVQKSELLIQSGSTSAILEGLVKKEILLEEKMSVSRLKKYQSKADAEFLLSKAQQTALESIEEQFVQKSTVLLYGLTGSGKTELYIQLIKSTISANGKVVFLLPEIALTTQIVGRLEKYFGDDIIVYHSKFNESERVEIWNRIKNNQFKIILGARSALFLPFEKIDLFIIDEEHDGSYKQMDPSPRYHARDAALYYASLMKSKVLLGSATPSAESYFNAQTNKYGWVQLLERYGDGKLPTMEIIDIKQAEHQKSMKDSFSVLMIKEMEVCLKNKEQIILFQNRRGYAPYLECGTCAWTPFCKFCDVGMTYHKGVNQLVCHYCNYRTKVPTLCLACNSSHLSIKGLGTEKVEDEIKNIFPDAKIERMDWDTTRGKDAHSKLFKRFENREIDILVGTQMIAKGLDFDNVSMVGVVNADSLLFMPDYKINERAYQMLCQVAGRAGRSNESGKVFIQTSHPTHPIFNAVLAHDTIGFLRSELLERQQFFYPPYVRMIKLTLKYKDEKLLEKWAQDFLSELNKKLKCTIIGPIRPLISKIQNLYCREFIFKFAKDQNFIGEKNELLKLLQTITYEAPYRNIRFVVNVDV